MVGVSGIYNLVGGQSNIRREYQIINSGAPRERYNHVVRSVNHGNVSEYFFEIGKITIVEIAA